MSNVQYWEIQELALFAMGKTDEEVTEIINNDGECDKGIDELIYEEFGVDFDQFSNIAKSLLKLTPCVKSAVTGKFNNAFVRKIENNGMVAIVQQEA